MGIPFSMVMDAVGTTGRGAVQANELKYMDFESSIKAIQERFAYQIVEKYIKRYMKAKGMDLEKIPSFIFKSEMPSNQRERYRNIQTLARRGIILRDPKVAKRLMEELGLPIDYVKREIEVWDKDVSKLPTDYKEKSTEVDKTGENVPEEEDVEE